MIAAVEHVQPRFRAAGRGYQLTLSRCFGLPLEADVAATLPENLVVNYGEVKRQYRTQQ